MFEIQPKVPFTIRWDYDLVKNPGCSGFHIKMLNSSGATISNNEGTDRNIRKKSWLCNDVGIYSIVICAVNSNKVEGTMSDPVYVNCIEKTTIPNPPPVDPNPNIILGPPTNVRLEYV